MQEGCGYVFVTCHTTNLTSCHPLVTQHCESPWQGQLFTGSRSPHLPHCRVPIDLMRPRARASSWRINNEIYSAMSYGSLPGRLAAQLRASISSSCASSVNSSLRSPAAAWRARCFALRTAADSGITHRPFILPYPFTMHLPSIYLAVVPSSLAILTSQSSLSDVSAHAIKAMMEAAPMHHMKTLNNIIQPPSSVRMAAI